MASKNNPPPPTDSVSSAHEAVHGSLVLACHKPYKQNQVIGFCELQEVLSLDLFSSQSLVGLHSYLAQGLCSLAGRKGGGHFSQAPAELSQPAVPVQTAGTAKASPGSGHGAPRDEGDQSYMHAYSYPKKRFIQGSLPL